MNQLKVRTTLGEYDKLTLSPEEIVALSKQFKNTRVARKHTQTRVGGLYNVTFQIISDWEHSLRVTPFAEACMRDYIEGDTTKLENFVLEFQNMHNLLNELLPMYYQKHNDRLNKRELFMDKLKEMKLSYYSLKDFDKINVYREIVYFLDLDGNSDLILILYNNLLRSYRNFVFNYYSAFIKAQKSINDLLALYGIKTRIEL